MEIIQTTAKGSASSSTVLLPSSTIPSSRDAPVCSDKPHAWQNPPANTQPSWPSSGWLVFTPGSDDQALLGTVEADSCEEATQMVQERWPEQADWLHFHPAEGVRRLREKRLREVNRDPSPHAFHEAGHAIIACHYGWRVRSVDIHVRMFSAGGYFHPDRDSLGRTRLFERPSSNHEADQRQKDEQFMTYVLAGPVAESRFRPGRVRWRTNTDLESIQKLFAAYRPDDEAAYLREMKTRTSELVAGYWAQIEETARVLVDRRALTGADVDALFKKHIVR